MKPIILTVIFAIAAFSSGGKAQAPERASTPQPATDLAGYIASLEEPGRAEWQKPDEVIRALDLKTGDTLCDVGSGPGYFALRAARRLESSGWVYAEDVEATMIDALRDRVSQARLSNVTPILGLPDDPLLPKAACDVILVVNTYHLFPNGPAFLRRLGKSLKARGRLVNIDFQKRETPQGPILARRVAKEAFLADALRASFIPVGEETFLPYQYFVVLQPIR
ncbi:MAG: methyltransferase domain-containing protein [Vicinamibacteria bacterium]|nr:methyltransferase domain-containing protein [Vicinamibacteria bacterium]